MNEFELIARYFRPLGTPASQAVCLGGGDDCAVVAVPDGQRLAITVDTLVAGVHFPEEWPAADVGYRALAVNLSDLAAQGATPAWYTLALTVPTVASDWLAGFAEGMAGLAREVRIPLIGGDTTRGPLTVTVQAAGYVTGRGLTRSGARVGDGVYVSGSLGDASAGLAVCQGALSPPAADAAYLRDRFARPVPRVKLGAALSGVASACIDLSDGLMQDLGHVAEQSGVSMTVDLERLPLSSALQALGDDWRLRAATGGDDYELAFTVPPERESLLAGVAAAADVPFCRIGTVTDGTGVTLTREGQSVTPTVRGWQHFAEPDST